MLVFCILVSMGHHMSKNAEETFRANIKICYINHGKEMYMANILPETEVEGSMIRDIHLLTMVHIVYTIVRGQIT